jgi:SAM-dependent methyltransferase
VTDSLLAVPPGSATHQALVRLGLKTVHEDRALIVLQGPADLGAVRAQLPGMQKVFESIWMDKAASTQERSQMTSALFDWLGTDYRRQIMQRQNTACYEALFLRAQDLVSVQQPRVLDIGCGPATILQSSVLSRSERCVGFDLSPVKRREAREAGLKVFEPDDFATGTATFDIALAAYVMHYEANVPSTISAVSSQLKAGGCWAMNFHKRIGYSEFAAALRACDELQVVSRDETSMFGPIVLVAKKPV